MEDLRAILSWISCLKSELNLGNPIEQYKWFVKRDVTRTVQYMIDQNSEVHIQRAFAIAARYKGTRNGYEFSHHLFDAKETNQ